MSDRDATHRVEGDAHRVDLVWRDGHEESVRARIDETVLAAAERAEVGLPFGCRTGACGTCTGRLLAGDLEHVRPPRALKERHREDGYALLCIAEPRSSCRVEVGAAVHGDLVENPWK